MAKSKRVYLYDTDLPLPIGKNPKSYGILKGSSGIGELAKIEYEFCLRYTTHYDASRAAREAGYSPASSYRSSRTLLKKHEVRQQIALIEKERLRRLKFDGDEFLAREIILATAPLTELVETWIPPCRYCWGRNNEYQRTYAEFLEAYEDHIRQPERRRGGALTTRLPTGTVLVYDDAGQKLPFDQKGGDGYDPEQPPNPACPNCIGRGLEIPERGTVPYIKYKDSRELSDIGKILYAGIERNKDGIRVLVNNQEAARSRLMTMLGKFLDLRAADITYSSNEGEKPPISFQMALTGGASRLVNDDPKNMSDRDLDAALALYGIDLSIDNGSGGEGEDSIPYIGETAPD